MAANYYVSLHSHFLCEAFLCSCGSRALIIIGTNQLDVKQGLNPKEIKLIKMYAYVPTVTMVNTYCQTSTLSLIIQ
jgi:hypothetical protein